MSIALDALNRICFGVGCYVYYDDKATGTFYHKALFRFCKYMCALVGFYFHSWVIKRDAFNSSVKSASLNSLGGSF